MNSKLVAFIALFAVLIGCVASAREETIKLHIYEGSSNWWVGVDPQNDRYDTVKIEIRGASDSQWTTMTYNPGWPYFHIASESGTGFAFPLSFRLTAVNGQQVIATIYRISSNVIVDSGVQYAVAATQAPTQPATQAPTQPATQAPTQPATQAPTQPATQAPTQPATQAPTEAATQAPTEAATQAPTQPATQAPTEAATQAPTTAPTTRPGTAPTTRPGTASTTRPTEAATVAPTTRPTEKPTSAPTEKPTSAPTQKPTSAPTQPATQAPTQLATGKICSIVPTTTEAVKILVPLYVYPGAAWDTLIAAANNGAQIIAIINPNSGPNANGPDSAYSTYMRKFQAAGIEMVGYVHTEWGARSISTVNTEIGIWASKYPGVTGIFFDEGSAEAKDVPYYREAWNTVLSKGFVHAILNPGVQPDEQYLDISTNIVIFENYASELARAKFDDWVKCAPASKKSGYQYKFSPIIHTATQAQVNTLITQAHNLGMGLIYITDGPGGCCTYNYLNTYFAAQASAIKQFNLA